MIRLALMLLFCTSAVLADATVVTQPVRIVVSEGQIAELTWREGQAVITGPAGAPHSFEAYDLDMILPDYEILRRDIDRDGVDEILVPTGIGYGGVNVFYVILFWRGDSWWSSPDIANPEFSGNHQGLTGTAKSGPFYYRERWDLDQRGNLYLHTRQFATFAGFDVRYVMVPGSAKSAEILVYETTNLFQDATPVWGVVQDEELPLSATSEGGDVNAVLRSGMGVELLEFDQQRRKVLVRASTGQVGWTDPEALLVDP